MWVLAGFPLLVGKACRYAKLSKKRDSGEKAEDAGKWKEEGLGRDAWRQRERGAAIRAPETGEPGTTKTNKTMQAGKIPSACMEGKITGASL